MATAKAMSTELKSDHEAAEETIGDGDHLGWYPDGNKRTLTDDQIAMFRHSEIYSILRERQVRRENREADGEDQTMDFAATGTATPGEPRSSQADSNDDLGEAQEDLYQNSTGDPQSTSWASLSKNKRKRDLEDTGHKSGKASTRRLVRELDSVAAEDQTLDYGDESATTVSQVDILPEGAIAAGLPLQAGNDVAVAGKKIWWPTFQTN